MPTKKIKEIVKEYKDATVEMIKHKVPFKFIYSLTALLFSQQLQQIYDEFSYL